MPRDFTTICFVVMPFGVKPVGSTLVDFDGIYSKIFDPAVRAVPLPEGGQLEPRRTDRDFFSGDIGQEMFEYLNHSRMALADITGLNANVMYEIGVRHAVRECGTTIVRQCDAPIPFDINRIKAFAYAYQPEADAVAAGAMITRVIAESLQQNALDSPVQQAIRAQREDPTREEVQALLLDAENALRRFDPLAAIAKLREALTVGRGNVLIHLRLGILLRDQGDLEGAMSQFTEATNLQPDYSDAWRERGIQEGRLTKGAKGEESLRKAIALNPNDFDALASLGGLLRKMNRFEEAAASYQRAVEVSNGHPYPLLMAVKLRAKMTRALVVDGAIKRQMFLGERVRQSQAKSSPPIDAPWSMFDLAEFRLYAGDAAGFLTWVRAGLATCQNRWEPETFRSALQLLVDGGVQPSGLAEGLPLIDEAIAALP